MIEVLKTVDLAIGYGSKTIASNINASLLEGELVCLIGANGSGKSTILRTISGLLPILKGKVELQQQDLSLMSPVDLAQHISMVLTDKPDTSNLRVEELIALGRSPYTNWLGNLHAKDKAMVDLAMKQTNVNHLAKRMVKTLSDGQKQRVMIAKALAQDTPILFLDEPTAHLDLPNRVAILHLLHRLTKETNKSILLSTHELDLAMQVADKIWLFDKKNQLTVDIPEALVLNEKIAGAFDSELLKFSKSSGQFELQRKSCVSVAVTGKDEYQIYWTKKALIRSGFEIVTNPRAKQITVDDQWHYEGHAFNSIAALLSHFKV